MKKRVCYKCGVEKNLSSKNFHRSKLVKHGFDRRCKSCYKEYSAQRPTRGKVTALEAEVKELKAQLKQNDFLTKMMKT